MKTTAAVHFAVETLAGVPKEQEKTAGVPSTYGQAPDLLLDSHGGEAGERSEGGFDRSAGTKGTRDDALCQSERKSYEARKKTTKICESAGETETKELASKPLG